MTKEIYSTVQKCIETSKSIQLFFRIDLDRWVIKSGDIKLFDSQITLLLNLLKSFHPDYYEELKSADDNIARLVPLYHSIGTVRDTSVVPLVAVAGTGTIRVL